MQIRVEDALKRLSGAGPLYKRVGQAARCLLHLRIQDFPSEIAADATLLFSIFPHIQYAGEYPVYSTPLRLQRDWVAALHRVYRILMIARGAASVLPVTEVSRINEACEQQALL